jgi:hypothetical protein
MDSMITAAAHALAAADPLGANELAVGVTAIGNDHTVRVS